MFVKSVNVPLEASAVIVPAFEPVSAKPVLMVSVPVLASAASIVPTVMSPAFARVVLVSVPMSAEPAVCS